MSPDTPIAFSLPSAPPGTVDATGLCTIQIIRTLEGLHNETMVALSAATAAPQVTAVEEGSRDDDRRETAPCINCATPSALVRRQVLDYKCHRDLAPLVSQNAVQALGHGDGRSLGFDASRIETELCEGVLRGLGQLVVHVRQFEYANELRQVGVLAALAFNVPQEPLPMTVAKAVAEEMDTATCLSEFLHLLEQAAHVVASLSATSGGLNKNTFLGVFAQKVLLVPEKVWSSTCPSAVTNAATLAHLRDLIVTVEAHLRGSPSSHTVMPRYRMPLGDEETAELKRATGAMFQGSDRHTAPTLLLAPLRDLLSGLLSDPDTQFNESESLKMFLTYQDVDLMDEAWFQDHFPATIPLSGSLEAYLVISAAATQDSNLP